MNETRRCVNTLSHGQICDTPVTRMRTEMGQTIMVCIRCRWRDEGRCWECGAPRTNDPVLGIRCASCAAKSIARSNQIARNTERAKAARKAYDAARYQARKAAKQHGNA